MLKIQEPNVKTNKIYLMQVLYGKVPEQTEPYV